MENILDRKAVNTINKELSRMAFNRSHTLQDFLEKAPELHPLVSDALEGIYCGVCSSTDETACATSNTQLGNTRYYLHFGWYIDPGVHAETGLPPRIEYAYIS